MLNKEKLGEIIREEINKHHRLGEHAGGSGHLGYRSITKMEIGDPQEFTFKNKRAFKIKLKYEIYTETEFLHPPEKDDLYTEHHRETIILDENLEVLDFKSLDE